MCVCCISSSIRMCYVIAPDLHPPTPPAHTNTQSTLEYKPRLWFMRPALDGALQGNALSSYLPLLKKAGLESFRAASIKPSPPQIHTATELQERGGAQQKYFSCWWGNPARLRCRARPENRGWAVREKTKKKKKHNGFGRKIKFEKVIENRKK